MFSNRQDAAFATITVVKKQHLPRPEASVSQLLILPAVQREEKASPGWKL